MDRSAEDALNALPRAALAPEDHDRSRQRGRGRGRGRGGGRSRSRSPLVQYCYTAPASENTIQNLVLLVATIASSLDIHDDVLSNMKVENVGEVLAKEAKAVSERMAMLASPAMMALKEQNERLMKENTELQDTILDKQLLEEQ